MPSLLRTRLLVILLAALVSSLSATATSVAAAEPDVLAPEICLLVDSPEVDDADWSAIVEAVQASLALRPVLVPAPIVLTLSEESPSGIRQVGVWADSGTTDTGFLPADPTEGHCGAAVSGTDPDEGDSADGTWSAAITGEFLRAGTKRELAAAPTTPGFSSSIDVEWDEAADLVRTVLTFSGPLDIPNGTCWMDDVLSADGSGGTRAETTTGSQTSPFGDGVCGRFEEYLANGGAGAQAIVLLPRAIVLPAGEVRLQVDGVDVRDDAVHLWGTVEESGSSS